MSRPVISVEQLSKAYRLGIKEEIPDTFVGAATGWLKAPFRNFRKLRALDTTGRGGASSPGSGTRSQAPGTSNQEPGTTHQESAPDLLWALRDVSFDIQEGEVVGIIGRNGAGKSTLLKILSRITEPTHGRAVIRGRVSSLLEVGTGFHPELSGRENIYMNGTILGMRKKEIDQKFDEIVDFSGVEKFLDTPVKRYSSGMTVRLAFAVAAHLEPEVLIIDEVLAVGDAEFQKKCLGKMRDVAKAGRTVLFVSHNMAAVESLCHRALELNAGCLEIDARVPEVLSHYRKHSFDELGKKHGSAFENTCYLKAAVLVDINDAPVSFVPLGGQFRLKMRIASKSIMQHPKIGIGIDSIMGQRIMTVHTPASCNAVGPIVNAAEIVCEIPQLPLAPGEYVLKLALSENCDELEVLDGVVPFTVANAEAFGEGRGFHRGLCVAPSIWTQTRGYESVSES